MDVHTIFPQPIYLNKFESKKELDLLLTIVGEENFTSNNGNLFSEETYILDKHLKLSKFKNALEKTLNTFFQETYKPKNDIEIYITQSWLNVTKKNMHHHTHYHPNSFLSGVFYISTLKNDRIEFFMPNQMQDSFIKTFETDDYGPFNSSKIWFPVDVGLLTIFPSYLQHGVPLNDTEEDRVSLSFNTFVNGTLGSRDRATEIILEKS